jgi:glycosyltransferase involved in cell wall biosynthesis
MVKVAMVTPWNVRCGIYTYSEKLAKALAEKDVETYIIRLPRFGNKTEMLLRNLADSVPEEADVIHVQHEYGLYKGLERPFYDELQKHGKPITSTFHATGNYNVDNQLVDRTEFIVHNQHCKNLLEKGTPVEATIIPHGVDVREPVETSKAKTLLGIPHEAEIVGYVGFISPYKGLEDLIQALHPLEGTGMLIGGGWHAGPETNYMRNLNGMSNKLLPGRNQWLGFVEEEDLPKVYGAMDLVVVPSRYASESGALLMAIGYGKPVLAREIPPFKEKLQFKVETVSTREFTVWGKALDTWGTVPSLTKQIEYYLEHDVEREKLSEGAKLYAEKYSWSNIAEKHIQYYNSLL